MQGALDVGKPAEFPSERVAPITWLDFSGGPNCAHLVCVLSKTSLSHGQKAGVE